ncbi:MAG TPA: hypothetical protein VHQ01_00250, partial [Pyrinomonadaceae bacterium]|nr:hypothetical protein [Pyrinomonadaceae bacterium]
TTFGDTKKGCGDTIDLTGTANNTVCNIKANKTDALTICLGMGEGLPLAALLICINIYSKTQLKYSIECGQM